MRICCSLLLLVVMLLPINALEGYGKSNYFDAIRVSIIQLISNPELYHGKNVRVIGVVQIEFEGNSIYLSKDDLQYSIYKNGLWMDIDFERLGATRDDLLRFNGRYVLIEGYFNMNSLGHLVMWSGSIERIYRYHLWE